MDAAATASVTNVAVVAVPGRGHAEDGRVPDETRIASEPAIIPGPAVPNLRSGTVALDQGGQTVGLATRVVGAAPTPGPDLVITQRHERISGLTFVSFHLTILNLGTTPTVGLVQVDDTLPAELSFNSATGPGWTCGGGGRSAGCFRTTSIPPGSASQIDIRADIGAPGACAPTNTAIVQAAGDVDLSNNSTSETVILRELDVAIGKSHSGAFLPGGQGTYRLTVTNVGCGDAAAGIVVTDTLPSGLSFVSATTSAATVTCSSAAQTVTCTRSNALVQAASFTIDLTVQVAASATGTVTNTAQITVAGDTVLLNDLAVDLTIIGLPDLSLAKTHTGWFTVGVTSLFRLTVSNGGTGQTSGPITVVDTLPSGLGFFSGSGIGWSCSTAGQVVTCTRTTPLAAGASTDVTIFVSVPGPAGRVSNTATVSTPGDTSSANDAASDAALLAPANSLVVNSANDADDGACDTTHCSLREAILAANARAGQDWVLFDLPGTAPFTISPTSALPTVTEAIVIDGTSQRGYAGSPIVELSGASAPVNTRGLRITAGGSTVRGLVINRFSAQGIELVGGGNRIEGNYIGTTVAGTARAGNTFGVLINGSSNNTIGGATASTRNVISGNGTGIEICANALRASPMTGSGCGTTATGNVIQGNYIGTSADGTAALGNSSRGVHIDGGENNTIGGTAAGAGNVISGTVLGPGVEICAVNIAGDLPCAASSAGNVIQGNLIGTNAAGTAALFNIGFGVLVKRAANTTVGGTAASARNVISGNAASGVMIFGPSATGNVVQGNYIGPDAAGTTAIGNAGGQIVIVGTLTTSGAVVVQGGSNNTIGGTAAGARNVISGNFIDGVVIFGDGNFVQGNYIGVNVNGTGALANSGDGVTVIASSSTVISGNVIAANTGDGVAIGGLPAGTANVVEGNLIGLGAGGAALGNGKDGVRLSFGSANRIGGSTVSQRNLIGANQYGVRIVASDSNTVEGNYIGLDATWNARPNSLGGVRVEHADGNRIGGAAPGAGNVISGNGGHAVEICGDDQAGACPGSLGTPGAANNVVQGNVIGLYPDGSSALANSGDGVFVRKATGTQIGGSAAGAGNVISGNTGAGVRLRGAGTTGNTVAGNRIGTRSAGDAARPNGANGVLIEGASSNTIGGASAGARNLISGNLGDGVLIVVLSGVLPDANAVLGNYIGTDLAGAAALPNEFSGIEVRTGTNTTVGGTASGAGNLLSGNARAGLEITNISSTGTLVQGNFVGTNAAGTLALKNAQAGIMVSARNTTIGGTSAAARNVISGNEGFAGVYVTTDGLNRASGLVVRGNYIGTRADGTGALGNRTTGVYVEGCCGTAANGTIADNVIAFNEGDGIRLAGNITQVAILGNSIHSNAAGSFNFLGIDIGNAGVTPNDTGDADTGGNMLQNFPSISSATSSGTGATIRGTLNSGADTTFRVELFSSPSCDPSGFGEGKVFLGWTAATTDVSGNGSFSFPYGSPLTLGDVVTGTATDPNNNTSEFSACATVGAAAVEADLSLSGSDSPDPVTFGASLTYSYTVTNTGPASASGVSLSVLLPSGVTSPVASPSAACTGDASLQVCALGTLADGASVTVSIAVTAPAATTGTITASASVSATTADPNPTNSTLSLTTLLTSRPPVADAKGVTTPEDTAVAVSLTASDPDSTTLTLSVVAGPAHGVLSGTAPNLTYTPALNYNGPDSFTYKANDGLRDSAPAVVSVAVTPVNDAPIAHGQRVVTRTNQSLSVALTADDVDGDVLTLCVVNQPAHGVVFRQITIGGGSAPVCLTGSGDFVFYFPNTGFNGVDSFTFKANDGAVDSAVVTVAIVVGSFVVNSANDANDGTCDAAHCSLREAILAANAAAGSDTIVFDIPGTGVQTIQPTTPLPALTGPTIVDATTQQGYDGAPRIQLDGINIFTSIGLRLSGGASTVRGLAVIRFGTGIQLDTAGGDRVEACYVGLAADGVTARGNLTNGILIQGVAGNTIGGTTPSQRNVITGSPIGVGVTGAGATGNLISGNTIGLNAAAIALAVNSQGSPVSNTIGIKLESPGNIVGGTAAGSGNIIAGNEDGVSVNAGAGNVVAGNRIGSPVIFSFLTLGNSRYGVVIFPGVSGTVVGGTAAGAGNVIVSNLNAGVHAAGANTLVQGNFIGTDAFGNAGLLGNTVGVRVAAGNVTVGGTSAAARNVISGNTRAGVSLVLSGNGALVQGNYIGTDPAGSGARGNAIGVLIDGSSRDNTIGGTSASARNVISGNSDAGVAVCPDPQPTCAVGTTAIQGNYIGLNAAGTAAVPNGAGVRISWAAGVTVGGTAPGAGNVISGNTTDGVHLRGSASSLNLVQGNLIGTNPAGTGAIGNGRDGVLVDGATGNTIGGSVSGARNVISGNGVNGVTLCSVFLPFFQRSCLGPGNSDRVEGNYIGTDITGAVALGNGGTGVDLFGNLYFTPPSVFPKNTHVVVGNVISGNGGDGIGVFGHDEAATIRGNLVGTNATGTSALPNGGRGISIWASAGTIVGGTASADRNVISGNGASGVAICCGDAAGIRVQGNAIGTAADGSTALGNGEHGVWVKGSGPSVVRQKVEIGGTATGAGNVIAYNTKDGVFLESKQILGVVEEAKLVSILGNAIFSNGELGIDLHPDGVTANDSGDGDTGANDRQNFPVVTSARAALAGTDVRASLNSSPSATYRVEFFASPICDASGNGEGAIFIGATTATTDATGNGAIDATMAAASVGWYLTATATDPVGNTSEFSACFAIVANTPRGTNVPVQPVDPTTGAMPVLLTFATVTEAGESKLATSRTGPATPRGFSLGTTPTYFDLTTNATFSGPVTVCISYGGLGLSAAPRLLHFEGVAWVDRTSSVDTIAQMVCAAVSSLSPFVVGVDVEPPTILIDPARIAVSTSPAACSRALADVDLGTATATDNFAVASVTNDAPASFPKGTTTVTWTATDTSGNSATATQTVTVEDTERPTISAPAAISRFTGPGATLAGVVITEADLGTATATDNCPGVTIARSGVPAGNFYPIGATTLSYTATDASGNLASATQTVTVVDDTPPVITAPANIIRSNEVGACGAVVSFAFTAADNSGFVTVTSTAASGIAFPTGTTTVTGTARDPSGNTASASFTITVNDTEAPRITAPAGVTVNTDPGLATASGVLLGSPTATDNCPGVSVAAARSDGAALSTPFRFGTTTVTYTATDTSGNTASATQTVTVLDREPPKTTATATPGPNAKGWSNTDVTVQLTAADNVAVREVSFALAGAQSAAAVIVAGNSTSVTIRAEGTTTLTYFATDTSGTTEAAHTLVVRIDRTAPEGVAQFDPATKDFVVSGRDPLSGLPGGFVVPISVVPVKDEDGEKTDEDGKRADKDGEKAERRTYRIVDDAGNELLLVAEVKRAGHEIKARIVSLRYNGGPVVSAARNAEKFEFALDRSGGIKELEQKLEIRMGAGRQEIEATFDAKKNVTSINVAKPEPERRITRAGLALLRLVTDKGKLAIEF